MTRFSISLGALAVALASQPLAAQEKSAQPQPDAAPTDEAAEQPQGAAARAHRDPHEAEILVTGIRRQASDVLGGLSVLDEEDLAREVRPSIGETLARQPGVAATGFGPTASRPILRGLGGDRIRILTDGIGSLDVSAVSADHAVSVNPLTAERIEVLRGPGSLVYGSSAIGGVVNIVDRRIPRSEPDGPIRLDGLLGYGTAADERFGNVSVDLPVAGHFIIHGDANYSKTDDLRAGGHLLTSALRAQAAASPVPEIQELADLKGEIPNTASESWEIAGGAAYVDGPLNVGFSVMQHDALYGVPIRFSLDPDVEAEAPTLDVKQTRYDARAEIPISGFFSQVRVRGAYSRYRHQEIEDTGEIASTFFTRGGEGRAEIVQTDRNGWGGTTGLQYLQRKVFINGEEKFLPFSRHKQFGLFTLQSLVRGPLRLEGGARVEFSRLNADEDADLGTPSFRRKFTTLSASAGAAYDFTPGWRAGLIVSHSSRAPGVEELFANGPHLASQAFEVGDPDLDQERSLSVEATLQHTTGPLHLRGSVYYTHFSNYIFQAPTGEIEDDLPVFQYQQGKATYYGFEVEADARLGNALGIDWGANLVADAVRATVKDFGPAPQIPPFRFIAGLTGTRGQFDGRVEVEHAFRQNRNASLETETDGYTLFNAGLDWHVSEDKPGLTLSLDANNLFDVVARRHSSLLKDFAPLAGRDIRLSARFNY